MEENKSVSFSQSGRFSFLHVIFVLDCIAGALLTADLLILFLLSFGDSSSMTAFLSAGIPALIPLTFMLGVLGLVFRKVALKKKSEEGFAQEPKYIPWMLVIGIYDVAFPALLTLLWLSLIAFIASVPI